MKGRKVMNEKVMKALRKVMLDENFQKEIFDDDVQSTDKLFELCKKCSDEEFTKKEFEFVLSELFVLVFENSDNLSDISESDLQNVAGGIKMKKVTAASLATLSLMGVIPTGIKDLDFTPKAGAVRIIDTVKYVLGSMGKKDKRKNGHRCNNKLARRS